MARKRRTVSYMIALECVTTLGSFSSPLIPAFKTPVPLSIISVEERRLAIAVSQRNLKTNGTRRYDPTNDLVYARVERVCRFARESSVFAASCKIA